MMRQMTCKGAGTALLLGAVVLVSACSQTSAPTSAAPIPSPSTVDPMMPSPADPNTGLTTGPVTVSLGAAEGSWLLSRAPAGTRCDVVLSSQAVQGGGYAVNAPGCQALPGVAVWEPTNDQFISLRSGGGEELVIVRSVSADRYEGWTLAENSAQITLSR